MDEENKKLNLRQRAEQELEKMKGLSKPFRDVAELIHELEV